MNSHTAKNLLAVLVAAVLTMITLKAVEIGYMQRQIEYNRHLIQKTNRRIAMLPRPAPSEIEGYVLQPESE